MGQTVICFITSPFLQLLRDNLGLFCSGLGVGGEGGGGQMEVRQTEEGFQESIPSLVSISYFPAQVKRSAGTSHVETPGLGQ